MTFETLILGLKISPSSSSSAVKNICEFRDCVFPVPMRGYSFSFPKIEKNILKGVKDFTTIDSFPILSINVTPKKVVSKFVQNSPSLAENENKFRSRNSFIIARSTLSSLLKENTYELKIVSKGVSNVSNNWCK